MSYRQKLTVLSIILISAQVFAGESCRVTCPDDKCGFKCVIYHGGGFVFEEVSGYCEKCNKCVSITWPRERKHGTVPENLKGKTKPTPIASVFDPLSGKTRTLYKCPQCESPFVEITALDDFKYCPKCKENTVKKGAIAHID